MTSSILEVSQIIPKRQDAEIDLAAILKASQLLAGHIQLDDLRQQLPQIILPHSGGDRCALILPNLLGEWTVEALATPEVIEPNAVPLNGHANLPVELIQYVKNTQATVLINHGMTDLPVMGDYFNQHQPHSVLCLPMLNQSKLTGILYLENRGTSHVFTHDRLLTLNFLCTQAAISLENAQLYQQAQARTHELNAFQERLQFLIQQTPIGVIEWNAAFKVIGWNPAAEKIFGFSAAEMLNQHAVEIVPESDRAIVAEVMQALMQQTGGFSSLNVNIRQDQQRITCEWTNTPLKDSAGNAIGIFSMVQDVSDRITAEQTILQKSQALEQALAKLQKAQLQTVQSEKMASLGNLVAGVAHEINNPIGFLNGSINNGRDHIQDLLGHLSLYQQHYPNPVAAIQDNAEAIDLEFLCEDLPTLIDSMKSATDRIKGISTSLRTFSRADTEDTVSADLHEGLDSTILILKYRLKANTQRPEIQIRQDYGELPKIQCFPGQLNQVFMNILANAIDALDEFSQRRKYADIVANPHQITIQTQLEDNQVKITIGDNGPGMPESIKTRIFDHLFTTKGVGKGTGLGLAIARQIIEEKHGGKLEVKSRIGQGTIFTMLLPMQA